jgi:hypothetical protein
MQYAINSVITQIFSESGPKNIAVMIKAGENKPELKLTLELKLKMGLPQATVQTDLKQHTDR